MNNLDTLEEFDITGSFMMPHLLTTDNTILARKKIALSVLEKKPDELLLINSNGFRSDVIFVGLTEKHIEYIAKNAPKDYKENLLKIQEDKEMMQGVFEIAQAMDQNLGDNITQNQQRVKNVIQYIQDNQAAFQF